MSALSEVDFVLHRPRSLDNVGAVARVVKNFGIGRLVLVDPFSYSFDRARKLAVNAEDVLENLYVHRNLAEALAESTFSAATTSRFPNRHAVIEPLELGARVAAMRGKVAIVFGSEKFGLSDEDLAPCHAVCRIPTDAAQPSMNLSQATAVVGFALRAAAPQGAPPLGPAPATQRELEACFEELSRALTAADFLNPQNPRHVLGELTRSWTRGGLSRREAELWRNALRHVAEELGRRATSRPRSP